VVTWLGLHDLPIEWTPSTSSERWVTARIALDNSPGLLGDLEGKIQPHLTVTLILARIALDNSPGLLGDLEGKIQPHF
jgi:hypothetical protein